MRFIFITPCFNASKNLTRLAKSVDPQQGDWHHHIVDDMSTDDTCDTLTQHLSSKRTLTRNIEKKYALRNIIEVARAYQDDDDVVIATIDGDDQLCNDNTTRILQREYESGADVVWTAHKWDTNGMNISRPMPSHVDPYSWAWCSSHLRTFRSSLLRQISDDNFKDYKGQWFRRGYDAALMLPLLHLTSRRVYTPQICYLYNLDTESIPLEERNWAERDQLSTINFVRARGFVR